MSIWPVSLVMVAKMRQKSSLDNPQSGWQRANAAPALGTTAWGGLRKIPRHPFSSMKRTIQFSTRPRAHWTTHLKLPLPAAIDPGHFLQLDSMQDTQPSRRTPTLLYRERLSVSGGRNQHWHTTHWHANSAEEQYHYIEELNGEYFCHANQTLK